jgi:hypothetical protein
MVNILHLCSCCRLARYYIKKLDIRQKFIIQEIRANEIEAYGNLKLIAAAQEKYIRKDWDSDGKKAYAIFYVHLFLPWRYRRRLRVTITWTYVSAVSI